MLGERLPERGLRGCYDIAGVAIKPDANIAQAVKIVKEMKIRRLTVVDEKYIHRHSYEGRRFKVVIKKI